jgi:hypothetical protein
MNLNTYLILLLYFTLGATDLFTWTDIFIGGLAVTLFGIGHVWVDIIRGKYLAS